MPGSALEVGVSESPPRGDCASERPDVCGGEGMVSDMEIGPRLRQVKRYFPVYMKHFWNPPQGEAKRDNNPTPSCAQCTVCGQKLFQRLMSRGLSDRGHFHIFSHPLSPLGCLVSLKLK